MSRESEVLAKAARILRQQVRPAIFAARSPLMIAMWEAPGEPVQFSDAVSQPFTSVTIPTVWGRPWGTTWFRARGEFPALPAADVSDRWTRAVEMDLGFEHGYDGRPGFQSEGLLYRGDGSIVKALAPRHSLVRLAASDVDLYVEAASNPDIAGDYDYRPTPLGSLATAGDTRLYTFRRADAVIVDETVQALAYDLDVVEQLLEVGESNGSRRANLLTALSRVVDRLDPDDVSGTAQFARDALRDVLATPAAAGHVLTAVGHAHIDSAWLWPTRETKRKVVRTFANALELMEQDPGFRFVASSAQHYAWVQEANPDLFNRVREQVRAGRFIPVGGMWVESDTMMPTGEAMVRQFIVGKEYFRREFDIETDGVWLPDSFGYSAALPQILRGTRNNWFLSQKLSWNDTNEMPHHTFDWQGIDGSRIVAHFPPVDTYNSTMTVAELLHAERNFADHERFSSSLVPFGYGNGGGGPTQDMLARARRFADLQGVPRVELDTPQRFFERVLTEREQSAEPSPTWLGEMYLENHRGIFTSQARTKRGNRLSESRLHEAETWAALASWDGCQSYPYVELDELWKSVLLLQFHDILPGSSIRWVHEQAESEHERISTEAESIIVESLRALTGPGTQELVAQATSVAWQGAQPYSIGPVVAPSGDSPSVVRRDGYLTLDNGLLKCKIDESSGDFVSITDKESERDALSARGRLILQRDAPGAWDAWNVDLGDRARLLQLTSPEVATEATTEHCGVRMTWSIEQRSRVSMSATVRRGDPRLHIAVQADWHEHDRLLRLDLPLDVSADRYAAETQFGHLFRATHTNTSWEAARFEACTHRWVYVGEPDWGVAVANSGSYGHSVRRAVMHGDLTSNLLSISLLRSPQFPDPDADRGLHELFFTIRAGAKLADAVDDGYLLNIPPRSILGASGSTLPLHVLDGSVRIETVKLAEDRTGDLIIRLYEACGLRAEAIISLHGSVSWVDETDLLERSMRRISSDSSSRVQIPFRPFQIRTLRLRRVQETPGTRR